MRKKVEIKLKAMDSNKEFMVFTIEHAERLLLGNNNKKGLIKLVDKNFELTKDGLRKRSVTGGSKNSDK